MTMKIGYILRHFPLPSETFVINEIVALQSLGVEIFPVSIFPPEKCQEMLMAGVEKEVFDLTKLDLQAEACCSAFFKESKELALKHELSERFATMAACVADHVVKNSIELLHAHFATESALTALLVSKLTGIPFSFTAHAYDLFIPNAAATPGESLDNRLKVLAANSAHVVTISDFNREYILSRTDRKLSDKVSVIHCGIDPSKFRCVARPEPEAVTFLSVGRFVEKKGHEHLVRAFGKVASVVARARLRLVGEGPLKPGIIELCAKLNLTGRVDFVGAVPSETVLEEMLRADVFVLHSVTSSNGDMEGIPVSIMEAAATGLPVVSTRHAGISELVTDGVTGFLTEEKDVELFAQRMIDLCASQELRKTMGSKGSTLVREEYDLRGESGKLKELFSKMAADRLDLKVCGKGVTVDKAEHKSAFTKKTQDDNGPLTSGKTPLLKASIIICTYNRSDLLRESIRAAQSQDFPPDQFEIIVIDNNSKDDTRMVVEEMASTCAITIRYVFEDKQGLSFARNAGINSAEGEVIIFIDDDIDAEKSWLRHIVAAFDDPEVACAGGPIRPLWPFQRPDWLSKRWQGHFTISEFEKARETGQFNGPDYPWGANIAFRRDVFETIGQFPTDLGRVGACLLSNEEINLCRNIEASGRRILFAPEAVIHHKIAPERIRKLWLYHRTYWQGRSNAVLDLNTGKNINDELVKCISEYVRNESDQNLDAFDRKCINRAKIGYIHHLMAPAQISNFAQSFRNLRTLKLLLRSLVSAEKSKQSSQDVKIVYVNKEPDASRSKHEIIQQKDDQINALLDSLSWRVTKPLRTAYDFLSKFNIIK